MDFLRNTKGITPIIAVILLLMMTIAIAGLAYSWLQRTQTTIQTSTENITTTLLSGLKVNLKVEGYNATCSATAGSPTTSVQIRVYGRNAGTESAKNVYIYVDDAPANVSKNSTLEPGTTTSWGGCQGTGCPSVANGDNCSLWVNLTKTIKLVSDESTAEKSFTFACTTYYKGGVASTGTC